MLERVDLWRWESGCCFRWKLLLGTKLWRATYNRFGLILYHILTTFSSQCCWRWLLCLTVFKLNICPLDPNLCSRCLPIYPFEIHLHLDLTYTTSRLCFTNYNLIFDLSLSTLFMTILIIAGTSDVLYIILSRRRVPFPLHSIIASNRTDQLTRRDQSNGTITFLVISSVHYLRSDDHGGQRTLTINKLLSIIGTKFGS